MTTLSDFTLKVFEGYIVPFPFKFLYIVSRRIHYQRAQELIEKRDDLRKEIQRLEKQMQNRPKLAAKLEKLKDEYYLFVANYSMLYPEDLDNILPTRFGNILKAAEDYSAERYGFDSVSFWPRLMQVIPDDYKLTIDNARNDLLFHVNMSILSFLFSCLCVLAVFYSMWITNVESGNLLVFQMFLENALRYLVAASLGFVVGGFFYNTSVMSAKSFSLVIRTGVDLFRMELLKKFGVEIPRDSAEEFERWNNLNELIVLGSHSLTFKKIDYRREK